MADDTVAVKITADASGVAPGVNTAKVGVEGLGASVAAASAQMRGSFATVSASVREMGVTIRETVGVVGEMKEMMMGFGEALIAAFAIEKIADWAKEMAEGAEKTKHLSEQFGMTTDQVQQFGGIAAATGIPLNALTKGMGILDKNAVSAATGSGAAALAFKAVGISANDGRSQMDRMLVVADKFKDMADGPNKVALAMLLFGKSGRELIPVLNLGAEGLAKINEKSAEYGAVNAVAVEKGVALAESVNESKLAMLGVSNVMTDALAPMLKAATDGINELIKAFIDSYKEGGAVAVVFEVISGACEVVGAVFGALGQIISTLWNTCVEAFKAIAEAVGITFGKDTPSAVNIAKGVFNDLIDIIVIAKDVLLVAFALIGGAVGQMAIQVKTACKVAYDALTFNWGEIQADWNAGTKAIADNAVAQMHRVTDAVNEAHRAMIAFGQDKNVNDIGKETGIKEAGAGGDFNPNLSKAPKAKKEKKPKDDLLQKLNTELEGEKAAFAMRQEAQGTYEAFALESEVKFWASKIGLTEAGSKDRAAVEAKWLAAVQALRKQDNAAALEAIKANAAMQIDAAKSDADQAKIALQTKINDVDTAERTGQITMRQSLTMKRDLNQQMLQADIDLAKAEETIHIAALENELRDEKLSTTQKTKINDQLQLEIQKSYDLIVKLNQKKDQQLIKDDNAVFQNQMLKIKQVSGSFSSSIAQMITLQQGFSATMKSLWQTVAGVISGALADVLTKYISQLITTMAIKMGIMKASGSADITTSAGQAGAAAYASTAAIPVVGPELAPASAAAAFTGAMSFQSVAAFAGGTMSAPGGWSLVGEQGPELVNLPRGAGVLTADQTRGQMGGDMHIHIAALDGHSVKRVLMDNRGAVADAMRSHVRYGGR